MNFRSQPIKDVVFNFTGFGPFLDVKKNPTTELIESIKKWVENNECEFNIGDIRVLDVTADDCKSYIQEIIASLKKKQASNPKTKQLLVHMGVDDGAQSICLEASGYNNADFGAPDNNKYMPKKQKIITDFALDHCLDTSLPAEKIIATLKKEKHCVELSNDPGRYICNYIYFLSLCEGSKNSIPSIFIHVPTFSCITKEAQEAFIKDFLKVTKEIMIQQSNDLCEEIKK